MQSNSDNIDNESHQGTSTLTDNSGSLLQRNDHPKMEISEIKSSCSSTFSAGHNQSQRPTVEQDSNSVERKDDNDDIEFCLSSDQVVFSSNHTGENCDVYHTIKCKDNVRKQLINNSHKEVNDKDEEKLRSLSMLSSSPASPMSNSLNDQLDKENNVKLRRNKIEKYSDCIVCQSRSVTCVILPCRHTVVCFRCLKLLDKCPMCRGSIDNYFKLKKNSLSGVYTLNDLEEDEYNDVDEDVNYDAGIEDMQREIAWNMTAMLERLNQRINQVFGFR